MKYLFNIILIGLLLSSCSSDPEFKKFSVENWKKDNLGCDGLRQKEVLNMVELKEVLYGAGETTITSTLGRPNRHELGKRMKKNYFYYVESTCEDLKTEPISWLEVRFNSVSQVAEIVYKNID